MTTDDIICCSLIVRVFFIHVYAKNVFAVVLALEVFSRNP